MKKKLSIFGGEPVCKKYISYGRQYIDDADIQAVIQCLRGDYLTTGPTVAAFEARVTQITGAKYAVAVANGTAALHVACMAMGIKEGDEVITSPITFAASANCVRYCGGTPVFADIDPVTYNIDPNDIERKITPKTKAIIPVHYGGVPCDMDAINQIAKKHGLRVLEDAAHAIGTRYKGRAIGAISDLTEFSFHPVKTVTTAEGGAITTNDEKLYKKLILYRTHGITRDVTQLIDKDQGGWYYEMLDLGYNYRITDVQCALGISQLEKLPMFAARRKAMVAAYDKAFAGNQAITVQRELEGSDSVRHLYTIALNFENLNATRREVFDALRAEGVGVNVHYIPVYYFPYYQQLGYRNGICPNAEALYERLITIPLYPAMTDEEQASVVEAVEKVVGYYIK